MTKVKKDFPVWMDKERCPVCNSKLVTKHEGLVCKNFLCPLYFKCGSGWAFISGKLNEAQMKVNGFWNSSRRLFFDKRWNELKSKVLKRDNYICAGCGYDLSKDWYREKVLHVHHIVPSHKESAMYFDIENLITLCNECHDITHLADKHKFGNIKNGKN